MIFSNSTFHTAGERLQLSQYSQRSTSARSRGFAGSRSGLGCRLARYPRIALDSQRRKPSSSRTGTRPFGFFAKNAAVFASPLNRSIGIVSIARDSSRGRARTFQQLGEAADEYIFIG